MDRKGYLSRIDERKKLNSTKFKNLFDNWCFYFFKLCRVIYLIKAEIVYNLYSVSKIQSSIRIGLLLWLFYFLNYDYVLANIESSFLYFYLVEKKILTFLDWLENKS